jgi:hypothetical protein
MSHHICSAIITQNPKHILQKTKSKNSKKILSNNIDNGKGKSKSKGLTSLVDSLEHKQEELDVNPYDRRSPDEFGKDVGSDVGAETSEQASLNIPSPNTLKYLFRSHIPIDYLYDVLEKICVKKEKYYIIDFNSYRLLQFHDLYADFAERIIQAYKPSKQKYVTRTLTYNSFVTIVRHICRINGIPFDTKFNYQYSLYNIDYYIYYTHQPTPSLFPPLFDKGLSAACQS